MEKILWYLSAAMAELARGKVRPLIAYALDPDFRRDVAALRPLVGWRVGTYTRRRVRLGDIQPTHKVHYPAHVAELATALWLGCQVRPLTCVKVGRLYHVINGNHRLDALRRCHGPAYRVPVELFKAVSIGDGFRRAVRG